MPRLGWCPIKLRRSGPRGMAEAPYGHGRGRRATNAQRERRRPTGTCHPPAIGDVDVLEAAARHGRTSVRQEDSPIADSGPRGCVHANRSPVPRAVATAMIFCADRCERSVRGRRGAPRASRLGLWRSGMRSQDRNGVAVLLEEGVVNVRLSDCSRALRGRKPGSSWWCRCRCR
jgi:hypothetical protein